MTTEEKLKHFQDICMADARERSARALDDYEKGLESAYEEHTKDMRRRASLEAAAEEDKLRREMNKKLSLGQLDLKRELSRRQEELKEKLFVELKDRLARFMETDEYEHLLARQVETAKKLAGGGSLIIYMDPADGERIHAVAAGRGVDLRVSEYSFEGGLRAVIPERHILIDNSFETKLAEERRRFKFDLGGKQGD